MDISITSETENKLFSRKEILFTATYSGGRTPSREEIKEEICKKLSLNPDMTTVIKITQAYGRTSGEAMVHSYSKKEAMEGLTRKPKEKKAAAGATAPAKAPAAEAKAEPKKEEAAEKKEHKEKHDEKKEAPKEKQEPKKEEKKEEAKK
jgi:ribosomal protein S24E